MQIGFQVLFVAIMTFVLGFRKRQRVDEDDVASDGDEQDDFYDRTKSNAEKKQKGAVVVHDAASLYGRKVSYPPPPAPSRICILLALLSNESQSKLNQHNVEQLMEKTDIQASLATWPYSFSAYTQCKIARTQQRSLLKYFDVKLFLQAALIDECNSLLQKLKVEEKKIGHIEASNSKATAGPQANEDSLDAFMSDVKVELEHGKVNGLAHYLSSAKALMSSYLMLYQHVAISFLCKGQSRPWNLIGWIIFSTKKAQLRMGERIHG